MSLHQLSPERVGRQRRRSSRVAASISVLMAACMFVACAPEAPDPTPPVPTATQTPTPEPPTPEELRHEAAVAWVDSATTRELVGSVIMTSVPGTDAAQLHTVMEAEALGGFIIMGPNVPGTEAELRQLTDALVVDEQLPPLISIDEEGGAVTRLPWDSFAGANTLRFGPVADVTAAFRGRAGLLKAAGVNVNFGVIADVTDDPYSFIYERTLGDDPQSAGERVAAGVAGEQGIVATTIKHFPGHGAAPGDSHHMIPQTDKSLAEWRASDAVPFAAGINAGAELLMFGHLSYTQIAADPASLSPEWYAIARDELGFDGVTVTDDLGMLQASGLPAYQDPAANIAAAIGAGADLALIIVGMDATNLPTLIDQVTALVDSGTLPPERLRDAALRDVELRLELAEATPR